MAGVGAQGVGGLHGLLGWLEGGGFGPARCRSSGAGGAPVVPYKAYDALMGGPMKTSGYKGKVKAYDALFEGTWWRGFSHLCCWSFVAGPWRISNEDMTLLQCQLTSG